MAFDPYSRDLNDEQVGEPNMLSDNTVSRSNTMNVLKK